MSTARSPGNVWGFQRAWRLVTEDDVTYGSVSLNLCQSGNVL